jgi:Putative peptidoglycan binding domain
VPILIRRRTIAACFSLACLFAGGNVLAGQSSSSSRSSTSAAPSAHKKTSTHKHKHYAKRQPPGQKAPAPDRISEIQSALARAGYYQDDPNGKLDSNTVAAIQKFQSANGLDSSGKLDAPTLQKLGLGSDIAGVGAPKPVVPSCCSAPASATPASSTTMTSAPSTSNSQPQTPAGASPNTTTPAQPDPKPAQQ